MPMLPGAPGGDPAADVPAMTYSPAKLPPPSGIAGVSAETKAAMLRSPPQGGEFCAAAREYAGLLSHTRESSPRSGPDAPFEPGELPAHIEGSPRMLARWLQFELMQRLSSLDNKLDSLRERVDECHEGISGHEDGKAAKKGIKGRGVRRKSSSKDDIETPKPTLVKEVTPLSLAVEAVDKTPLEAARWIEEAPLQPDTVPASGIEDAEPADEGLSPPKQTLREFLASGKVKDSVRCVMDDPEYNRYAKWYATGMPIFVCISVLITLAQCDEHRPMSGLVFATLEIIAEVVFGVDLLIRLAVCKQKATFLCNFHNQVDIMCVVPLFVRLSLGAALTETQMESFPGSMLLYVLPMIRLLKTLRGFKAFSLICSTVMQVYIETWPTILVLVYVVLFFATIIYYVEPRDNVSNYPYAVWFVLVTMTTVGYGDMGPSTSAGYIVSAAMVFSSMFVMALPLGIIGTAVSEIWNERHSILLRSWAREKLAAMGHTPKDIPQFFAMFDTDGSGEMDFPEFCAMLDEMKVNIRTDKLRELFKSFDEDDSGYIDCDEFICKLYPPKMRKGLGDAGEEATANTRKKMQNKLDITAELKDKIAERNEAETKNQASNSLKPSCLTDKLNDKTSTDEPSLNVPVS